MENDPYFKSIDAEWKQALECFAKTEKTRNPSCSNEDEAWKFVQEKYEFCTLCHFEEIHYLEKGATAEVHLARHLPSKQLCALKKLRKDHIKRRFTVEICETELQILKLCRDCNFIVDLYGCFSTDTHLYFCLEYCPGADLGHLLKIHRKPSTEFVRFFACEVASAIQFLHDNWILYRDLKPQNITLNAQGHVRICDFGYSKILADKDERAWTLCGTNDYLSPEQVDRSGHSFAADWWSFGVLLCFMTTGRLPFTRGGKVDKDRLRRGKLPALFCDKGLSDLIKSLLQVEEEKRMGFNGISDMESHSFFSEVSWEDVVAEVTQFPADIEFIKQKDAASDHIGLSNFKNSKKKLTQSTAKSVAEDWANLKFTALENRHQPSTSQIISWADLEYRILKILENLFPIDTSALLTIISEFGLIFYPGDHVLYDNEPAVIRHLVFRDIHRVCIEVSSEILFVPYQKIHFM